MKKAKNTEHCGGRPLTTPKISLLRRQLELREYRMAEESVNLAGRKCVAIDCEMVGTLERGRKSELARCSIVDVNGKCIMDEYVKPQHEVVDYRTRYSGIRPVHLRNATKFSRVRRRVKRILNEAVLVGHALRNDLGVLQLSHPRDEVRDSESCKRLRCAGLDELITPSLRKLTLHHLDRHIQNGEHDSVEDARASMDLYRKYESQWELELKFKNVNWLDDEFWPESISNCNSRCTSACSSDTEEPVKQLQSPTSTTPSPTKKARRRKKRRKSELQQVSDLQLC